MVGEGVTIGLGIGVDDGVAEIVDAGPPEHAPSVVNAMTATTILPPAIIDSGNLTK
jgi:hypothetical protein